MRKAFVVLALATMVFLCGCGAQRLDWQTATRYALDGELAAGSLAFNALRLQEALRPGSVPFGAQQNASLLYAALTQSHAMGFEAVGKGDRAAAMAALAKTGECAMGLAKLKADYCPFREEDRANGG